MPCLFVWFLLISLNVVYYATVWPKLVQLARLYDSAYLSFGFILAVKICLLVAILVNFSISTWRDPGRMPQSKSNSEQIWEVHKEQPNEMIVVNVCNQNVELKWCSVSLYLNLQIFTLFIIK